MEEECNLLWVLNGVEIGTTSCRNNWYTAGIGTGSNPACSLYLLTTATTTTVYFCQFGVSVYVCWGYVNILHWTVCRFSYRPIKQSSVASRQKVLGKSIDTTSRKKRSAGEVLIISKRAIMLCHGTSTPDTSSKLSIDKKTLEDMASHLTEYH